MSEAGGIWFDTIQRKQFWKLSIQFTKPTNDNWKIKIKREKKCQHWMKHGDVFDDIVHYRQIENFRWMERWIGCKLISNAIWCAPLKLNSHVKDGMTGLCRSLHWGSKTRRVFNFFLLFNQMLLLTTFDSCNIIQTRYYDDVGLLLSIDSF